MTFGPYCEATHVARGGGAEGEGEGAFLVRACHRPETSMPVWSHQACRRGAPNRGHCTRVRRSSAAQPQTCDWVCGKKRGVSKSEIRRSARVQPKTNRSGRQQPRGARRGLPGACRSSRWPAQEAVICRAMRRKMRTHRPTGHAASIVVQPPMPSPTDAPVG